MPICRPCAPRVEQGAGRGALRRSIRARRIAWATSTWLIDAKKAGRLPVLIYQGVLSTELVAGRGRRPARRGVGGEGRDLHERHRARCRPRRRSSIRPAKRSRTGRSSPAWPPRSGLPFTYASVAGGARRDRPRRWPARAGYEALGDQTFNRPLPLQHWLQASNPMERWKWNVMFQDLPPVKGHNVQMEARAAAVGDSAEACNRGDLPSVRDDRRPGLVRPPPSRPHDTSVVRRRVCSCCRGGGVRAAAARDGDAVCRSRTRRRRAAHTRVALAVALPEKLHVQSDKPRDPSLIPTVLTVERSGRRAGRQSRSFRIRPTSRSKGRPSRSPCSRTSSSSAPSSTLTRGVPAGELVIPGTAALSGVRRQGVLPAANRTLRVEAARRARRKRAVTPGVRLPSSSSCPPAAERDRRQQRLIPSPRHVPPPAARGETTAAAIAKLAASPCWARRAATSAARLLAVHPRRRAGHRLEGLVRRTRARWPFC